MENGEKTYTIKQCAYRKQWVNQGLICCDKGKNPFEDCDGCEFQKNIEVKETWASSLKNFGL